MEFSVLGSGSKGNAYLVKEKNTIILIDAGLSLKEILIRIKNLNLSLNSISAILLTHEHRDHIKGLENILKFNPVPLYLTKGTKENLKFNIPSEVILIESGRNFQIGEIEISPFPVPHDAMEPVGFTFHSKGKKIGFASDLGKVTILVLEKLKGSNLIAIESNHDEKMLLRGPYSYSLKMRIKSTFGHLSNKDAANTIKQLLWNNLKYVISIHLSEINNNPDLVKYYMEEVLSLYSKNVSFLVAKQREVIPFLEV